MCRVGVVLGPELEKYSFPGGHPFNRERYLAFQKLFGERFGAVEGVLIIKPRQATREELSLYHDPVYIDFVGRASRWGRGYLDYGDTPAFPGVFEAAAYTVGSTLEAFDMILSGRVEHAFNPLGGLHHARRGSAGGFCVFNDIGVLIEAARRRGFRKILYVDIDAHHGDGVYYDYEEDPELYIVDIHEDGRYLYPGTGFASEKGRGQAEGTKLNIPLPPYSGDEEALEKWGEATAWLETLTPELIILQCGADGLSGDPLTHLRYSTRLHREISGWLHGFSHRVCDARMIALGGGGYNIGNVASAWCAVIATLLGRSD